MSVPTTLQVWIDRAAVALYECRSLERVLVSHEMLMSTDVDPRPVDAAEQVRLLYACLHRGKDTNCLPKLVQFLELTTNVLGEALIDRVEWPWQDRVQGIVAEAYRDDYWYAASRDGNRVSHYRGRFSCAHQIRSSTPIRS